MFRITTTKYRIVGGNLGRIQHDLHCDGSARDKTLGEPIAADEQPELKRPRMGNVAVGTGAGAAAAAAAAASPPISQSVSEQSVRSSTVPITVRELARSIDQEVLRQVDDRFVDEPNTYQVDVRRLPSVVDPDQRLPAHVNSIYLYEQSEDLPLLSSTPICSVVDDRGDLYDVFYPSLEDRESPKIDCKSVDQFDSNATCHQNRTDRASALRRWSKVIQRYPTVGQTDWLLTNNDASFRAVLGPFNVFECSYGERRILLMGELHYSIRASCTPKPYVQTALSMKDPYFIPSFIYQTVYNTQQTVDVFIESTVDKPTSTNTRTRFLPRILFRTLPYTGRGRIGRQLTPIALTIEGYPPAAATSYDPMINLRVHAVDVRFSGEHATVEDQMLNTVMPALYRPEAVDKIVKQDVDIVDWAIRLSLLGDLFRHATAFQEQIRADPANTERLQLLLRQLARSINQHEMDFDRHLGKRLRQASLGRSLIKLLNTSSEDFFRIMSWFLAMVQRLKVTTDWRLYESQFRLATDIVQHFERDDPIAENDSLQRMIEREKSYVSQIKRESPRAFIMKKEVQSTVLTDVYVLFLDLSTLARMFRRYNESETDELTAGGYRSSAVTNSIVYAGSQHVTNLKVFFDLCAMFEQRPAITQMTVENVSAALAAVERDQAGKDFWTNRFLYTATTNEIDSTMNDANYSYVEMVLYWINLQTALLEATSTLSPSQREQIAAWKNSLLEILPRDIQRMALRLSKDTTSVSEVPSTVWSTLLSEMSLVNKTMNGKEIENKRAEFVHLTYFNFSLRPQQRERKPRLFIQNYDLRTNGALRLLADEVDYVRQCDICSQAYVAVAPRLSRWFGNLLTDWIGADPNGFDGTTLSADRLYQSNFFNTPAVNSAFSLNVSSQFNRFGEDRYRSPKSPTQDLRNQLQGLYKLLVVNEEFALPQCNSLSKISQPWVVRQSTNSDDRWEWLVAVRRPPTVSADA